VIPTQLTAAVKGERVRGVRALSPLGAAALAAIVACLVFANSIGNGFALDDVPIVERNVAIQDATSLRAALRAPYWPGEMGRQQGLWRPATTAVLGLTWSAGGGSPLAFHVLNVALHAGVTAAVVLLLAGVMPTGAALLAGLLFAVHPVHVEAVANVVGVAELLSTLFVLLACLVWTRRSGPADRDDPGSGPFAVPGPSWLALLVALYAAAFLAKEGAVVLPTLLLLIDVVRLGLTPRDLIAYARPRLASFAVLGITAIAILAARYTVLGSVANPLPAPGFSLLEEVPRVWTVAGVWPEYLRLLFFPWSLSSDYSPDLVAVATGWTTAGILGALSALTVLALALWSARRSREPVARIVLPFAVLWFATAIAPVSNLFFLSGVMLAERTLYLPSVGFVAVVGWGIWHLCRSRRRLSMTIAALVLVALAARTWIRNPVWASDAAVSAALVREHPESSRAQWELGVSLEAQGRLTESHRAFARALWTSNGAAGYLADVSLRMMGQEQMRAAATLLEQVLRSALSGTAADLLAIVNGRAADPRDAARWAKLAITHNPEHEVPWLMLSRALEKHGLVFAAVAAREKAERFRAAAEARATAP
jgi:protein O-mannosyl-transferase